MSVYEKRTESNKWQTLELQEFREMAAIAMIKKPNRKKEATLQKGDASATAI
jgi:hypothetical protein